MKYTKSVLEFAVKDSVSLAGVLRKLGIRWSGGSQAHIKNRIKLFKIDVSHFLGQGACRGKTPKSKLSPQEILVRNRTEKREEASRLRQAMIESGIRFVCCKCGLVPEWHGEPLVLEIHHKNWDFMDNRKENVCFECPNCHSQEKRPPVT